MHEDFSRDREARTSSDQVFGLVFGLIFAVIALLPLAHGGALRVWAIVLALAFTVVALIRPVLLQPLNSAWMKFGQLLHRVVSPIVMAILFFGTVTPIAFILRGLGKDSLRLKLDRSAKTYWIERSPPGPAPESIKNQF